MKLEELAEVFDGLATTLEKMLGKSALNDLRAVSGCFRQFPGENVTTFCNFIVQARSGKPAGGRSAAGINEVAVEEAVRKIKDFLDNRHRYDYGYIRQIVAQVGKLKVPEIKAIGERIECRLTERSKAAMLSTLESWLGNIKLSADQSSFKLSAAANQ